MDDEITYLNASSFAIGPGEGGAVRMAFTADKTKIGVVMMPNDVNRLIENLVFQVNAKSDLQTPDSARRGIYPIAVDGLAVHAGETPDRIRLALRAGLLSLMFDIDKGQLEDALGTDSD